MESLRVHPISAPAHGGVRTTEGPGRPPIASPDKAGGRRRAGGRRTRTWLSLIATLLVGGVLLHESASWLARWRVFNRVLLGRRWLEAGHLDRASEELDQALALGSNRPEPWQLASELAWRRGQPGPALDAAARAARASGNAPDYVLAWAELALRAAQPKSAGQALATLAPDAIRTSARALRVKAEIAGQQGNFPAAGDDWTAVVAVDAASKAPALSADEIQLGRVLLLVGTPVDRQRGLTLLARHAQGRDAGGRLALRILLADSVHAKDPAAIAKWAEALRVHPFCTLEDLHACLLACAQADQADFTRLLSAVRAKLAPSELRSAELLGWLSQMGRIHEASEWARSVRSADVDCPPLFVAVAEALREGALWPELDQWTRLGQWGSGVGLLRQAYRAEALAHLGAADSAETMARSLGNQGDGRAAETFLVAELLYSWGRRDQAVELLWGISEKPPIGRAALGMLVRHYQVQRDAAGLGRAFAAWHRLEPEDPMVATACAFFGSVSGLEKPAECARLAARILAAHPGDTPARCSLAVALTLEGKSTEALGVLRPVAADWPRSPAIAYAYGLALAGAGRPAEARPILGSIDPGVLTLRQVDLAARALR